MADDSHPNTHNEELPEEIRAALRRRYGGVAKVPPEIDRAILARTVDEWQTDSRRDQNKSDHRWKGGNRWKWAAFSVGTLISAALLVAVFQRQPEQNPENLVADLDRSRMSRAASTGSEMHSPESALMYAEARDNEFAEIANPVGDRSTDINQDGRFDILDAFALARAIHEGRSVELDRDQNGDGVVDQADIKALALTAVML